MKTSNRRRHPRLRLNSEHARVGVQLFPVLPFLGESMPGKLVNLSAGGVGIVVDDSDAVRQLRRSQRLRVHFRLPGHPLMQCTGRVARLAIVTTGRRLIGIQLMQAPATLAKQISIMLRDDAACDRRVKSQPVPWCESACAFLSVCGKSLRATAEIPMTTAYQMEVAFQGLDG